MKKTDEIILRIKSCYVADDCIQIMVPYRDAITIFSQDDILFHYRKGSYFYVNKYLEDERRKKFPYSNIPMHCEKLGLFKKINYANLLFEYDKPYIGIRDGGIIESYVVKDNNEALLINKIMSSYKRTEYMTREELEKIFDKDSYQNCNIYFLCLDGGIIDEYPLTSEEEFIKDIKKQYKHNIYNLKKNITTNVNDYNVVGDYLDVDPYFFDILDENLSNSDISNINFKIPVVDERKVFIVKTTDDAITIQVVEAFFINSDKYEVNFYDIPVSKYILEQLKYSAKVIMTKKPRIPLKLNPSVTKEDIKEAKKMVKSLKI